MRTFFPLTITLLVLFNVSCVVVSNPTSVPLMDKQAGSYNQSEYKIQAGDVLDIKFLYNPELNELALPVRPDGRISLQLVQDIPAAGSTPLELSKNLKDKYSSEIKKPEIAVIVRTFVNQRIFVDGEVALPRLVEFRQPTTVMHAIAQAGGVRETGKLSGVIVIRKDFEGKAMVTTVNLNKVIDGTDPGQDIRLMPYDVVYVPKTAIANVIKFVNQYINQVIPSRVPEFGGFHNPYMYSFGGRTENRIDVITVGP